MRGGLLNLPAIARALGFVFVAVAMIAVALHFRETAPRAPAAHADSAETSDPLADELERCQSLAMQAKDDAACEAAWAENRRHFFTYPAAPITTIAPAASPKTSNR